MGKRICLGTLCVLLLLGCDSRSNEEKLIGELASEDGEVREEAMIQLYNAGSLAVQPLINALDHEKWRVRTGAAQVLGEIGDRRAVVPLIGAAMSGKHPEFLTALGELKDQRATGILVAALKSKGHIVRTAAARALGEVGDPAAVGPLISTLEDQDVFVRGAAMFSLGEFKDARAATALVALLRNTSLTQFLGRSHLTDVLAGMGPLVVYPLLEAHTGNDGAMFEVEVYSTLEAIGEAALDPLLSGMEDSDPVIRATAVKYVGDRKIGNPQDPRVVELLINLLEKDEFPYVRSAAAGALSPSKEERVRDALVAALQDRYPGVRAEVVTAVQELKDPRFVRPLLIALRDRVPEVRRRAALALGKIEDPRVVEPLLRALGDQNRKVRDGVISALGNVRDQRVIDPLIAALHTPATAWAAATALSKSDDPRVTTALISALESESSHARGVAAESLGERGDARAVEPLIVALGDRHRAKAATALGALKDPRAIEPLKALLNDPDRTTRTAADGALRVLGVSP